MEKGSCQHVTLPPTLKSLFLLENSSDDDEYYSQLQEIQHLYICSVHSRQIQIRQIFLSVSESDKSHLFFAHVISLPMLYAFLLLFPLVLMYISVTHSWQTGRREEGLEGLCVCESRTPIEHGSKDSGNVCIGIRDLCLLVSVFLSHEKI